MDVYFNDTSSEVIQTFNKATTLIQEGKNQEGMELIQDLYTKQKIMIQ